MWNWTWSVCLFFADEKNRDFGPFADLTTAKKRYLTDEELKSFENYLENPADTTRLVIFAEGKLDSKRRLVKLLKRDGENFLRLQNSRKQI